MCDKNFSSAPLTVVPVLDLQQVADDAVGSHALRKVALRRLTPWSPLHTSLYQSQRGSEGTLEANTAL